MTNKEKFRDTLDSLHKELCDVSDWMYHNPELGFEEYETSKYLVNFIAVSYTHLRAHET